MFVLHQANGFQAPRDNGLHPIHDDLLRRRRHAHQSRGALAIYGLTGHAHRQPGGHGALPRYIETLRSFLQRSPHDEVVDLAGLQPRSFDRFLDHRRGQGRCCSVVECAAVRLPNRGSGGGDDDSFSHKNSLLNESAARPDCCW